MKSSKKIAILLLALIGHVVISSMATDAQELKKRTSLFDYDWRFSLADDQTDKSKSEFNDREWESIDLPHDWSILGKPAIINPSGNDGGYFPTGVGWYRKKILVPLNWKGRHNSIYFEGVYMNAEVFVNGTSLGTYPYGYTSFEYDLSPYLKYGTENVIAVKVDNSKQKNSRWYSGSGIYRHVWITSKSQIQIAKWGTFITTKNIKDGNALLQLQTTIANNGAVAKNLALGIDIRNKFGQVVKKTTVLVDLSPGESKELTRLISIDRPILWDTDHPSLYTANLYLKDNKVVLDTDVQWFGIRSISYSAKKGFELDGKKIKLYGGCVHHDNGSLGAAAYDRAEQRKAELLKSAGFNTVRTAHNPPSRAFLDACDKIGLLVIEEIFDGWKSAKNKYDYSIYFDQWAKRDTEAMVKRDRNHPSIIMWSIGNEVIERKDPEAVNTARQLKDYINKNDLSRPVTSAMTTWDKDWEIFDPLMAVHDIAGYNYQLHRAEGDHIRVPSRIILQTESYPRDAFANWQLVQKYDYIIGDIVWTAMDYLGESGIGRTFYDGETKGQHYDRDQFPWHGAYCGDIDITGWRKPISHYRSMLFEGHEKLFMAVREPSSAKKKINETIWSVWPTWESWSWPGLENIKMNVEVYSRYQTVRLYLNNTLIGEKPTSEIEQFKAIFNVPYKAGELNAIGIQNGKEIETVSLKSAGVPHKIKLTADRKTIDANGQDLCYVTVEILDDKGIFCAGASNPLQFNLSGAGTIAGIDNANLKDTTAYQSPVRNAWNGKAQVILKSKKEKGTLKLLVSGSGLSPASLEIRVGNIH